MPTAFTAMTLEEMRNMVVSSLKDSDRVYITDQMIDMWLNQAHIDIATRLQVLQESASSTTSGNTITAPANYAAVVSLRLGEDDVEFVSDRVFYSWVDDGGTPDHTLARVYDRTITLYPTPTTGTAYTLEYNKIPQKMTVVTDPSELPFMLQYKAIYFATAMAKYAESEQAEGDRFMLMYESNMPAYPTTREEFQPGPFTLIPDPTPLDIELEVNE